MERSTNALAELAEDLRVMGLDVDGKENEILDKAQRIVAKLAEVPAAEDLLKEEYRHLSGEYAMSLIHSFQSNCISECRAIAEEGAGDGK